MSTLQICGSTSYNCASGMEPVNVAARGTRESGVSESQSSVPCTSALGSSDVTQIVFPIAHSSYHTLNGIDLTITDMQRNLTMQFYPPEDYSPAQLASQMMMRFEWLEDYLQRICDAVEAAEV